MSIDPALAFRGTSLTFANGTRALHDVDLEVRPGEFVSLVGPSGCGKSTMLRLAAGFETATDGSVEVGAGRLGYVFQEATLLPWRTVARNVELPAELAGVPKAERREAARDAIERVGLAAFAKHRPSQLSGGMRMRASIARALTMRPELFLFDEPFGALDEITRQHLNAEVGNLFARDGFAGVFVTHSVPESVFMSTRVVVLRGQPGEVAADLPVPFPFPRDPELRYTAEFAALASEVSAALRGAEQEVPA
ncbi:MAG: ABC transporter ATP-binding protein [Glycomyces artemisiae]|uniref:ABC transporter ATP-binding protein n=1 Tax=Glycomyces artemisiae TaxID=1076443 RepID=A0A2T0UTB1_9ACTN|nr:ABC transporter ATP-binding protein [Glycomyces artemisiae]NUQ89346.1 ABC transporter ATP-binding protein [Glycomyces artemisiae]PRY61171.1 NitT/TauT family transport system ATP-binding protein [Glycomyces artemisiae]